MKFSMWLVNDWLEAFEPEPRITNGKPNINGVRYFSEGIELSEDLLYVGHAQDFIGSGADGVICANGEDLLLLNTSDIYLIFNEIQRMLEFYNEWEMGIMRAIDEGRTITEILEMTMAVLDSTLLVTDASHSMLGIVHHPDEVSHFILENGHLASKDVIRLNEILQKYADVHGAYLIDDGSGEKDTIRNFYGKNGDLIGWFVAMGAGDEHPESRLQLTEAFCHLLDFWFKINESALLFSPQSELFLDILSGKETDPMQISFRQEAIGWTGRPQMQLFEVKPLSSNPLDIRYLQKSLSSAFAAVYSFKYMAEILIIVNYQMIDQTVFKKQLSHALKQRKACCGSSYLFDDLSHLPMYYKQAELASRYGENKPGAINLCEDYTLEYLRGQINEAVDVSISAPSLEKLKQYDASSGTEYYQTLKVFLLNERDQTKAADILCIHRNTLIYRIKKIESIIEKDLNDNRLRFQLLISCFLTDPDFLS